MFEYDYSYWSVEKNDEHFASQERVIMFSSSFEKSVIHTAGKSQS